MSKKGTRTSDSKSKKKWGKVTRAAIPHTSLGSEKEEEDKLSQALLEQQTFYVLDIHFRDRYGYAGRRSNAVGERGQFLVARHAFTHAGGAGGKDTGARVGG